MDYSPRPITKPTSAASNRKSAVLLSTYDQGRQPFGLASPAAWLRAAGHDVVCADLSLQLFPAKAVREADAVFFFLPMHTAARMAGPHIVRARELNPDALVGCYGLYAPLNAEHLRGLGADAILGPECEADLVRLLGGEAPQGGLPKLAFLTPDREGLPAHNRYAKLVMEGREKLVGYTEASRGCKHLCRHCPVVPVYGGAFRVVQPEVVLEDVRRQVARGVQHITFGDPDFWNGPTHAVRIVQAVHREFPALTYDATVKIEHLRKHRDLLPLLRDTGCAFVTSAVESLDDDVLRILDKGHTREDFLAVAEDFQRLGLALSPTFIAFHPWTTVAAYRDFLRTLAALDLASNVAPIQLALRLLLPAGSPLLEYTKKFTGDFDPHALTWRWIHPDPEVDALGRRVFDGVSRESRETAFARVWRIAFGEEAPALTARAAIPYLTESWYC